MQIRCIVGDVGRCTSGEAGYKLHNNTMTYDKLINLPFVYEDHLSKKCVIFRLMPYASNVPRIISMCNQMVTSEIIP